MCSFIISSYYSSWSLLALLLVTTSLLCFSLGSLGTLSIMLLVSALELSQSYALSTVLRLPNLLGVIQSSLLLPISPMQSVLFTCRKLTMHTSKLAQRWFNDHGYTVMKWPAQSADINPIEHLWWHLKRRLAEYEVAPRGVEELWECCQVEWEKIPKEVCQNLIESMPRRVQAIIKAKGGYTKY